MRAAFTALMLLLAASMLQAQERNKSDSERMTELLEEGAPAYDAAQVEKWADEIIPLVERAAGREFRQRPRIELANRDKVAHALEQDLVPQLRSLMSGGDDEQVASTAKFQSSVIVMFMLGKYGITDKTVYLLPGNVRPVLKLCREDEQHAEGIAKLILAHELTHALQDQEVDLGQKLSSIKVLDESQAFSATIEGHAVFIQDLVGKELKLDEAVKQNSRLLSAGAVSFDDPALELQCKVAARQFEQTYLGGRDFIAFYFNEGGTDMVWKVLVAPPTTTAMIAKPETYEPGGSTTSDRATLFTGLEKEFGDCKWTVQNAQVGEMMMRAMYAQLGETPCNEIVSGVAHAHTFAATQEGKGVMGSVTVFEVRDPGFAPRMVSLLEDLARQNVEQLKASKTMRLEHFVVEEFPGLKGSVARRVAFELVVTVDEDLLRHGIDDEPLRMNQQIVRVARKGVLLELLDVGLDLDRKTVATILEKVFSRWHK